MLFNSYEFIFLFWPIVWLVFYGLGKRQQLWACGFLGLASLFYYGYSSLESVPLLLGSIVANYFLGGRLSETRSPRLLWGAIVLNLSLLAYFKYANFFISNLSPLAQPLGLNWPTALQIALPVGISFFTFTQIAFLVDAQRGLVRERNPLHYLLFVTYFPHLIAGPILHHKQMMPQFGDDKTYTPNWDNVASGLILFSVGLAKKVLLADPLAVYADGVFGATQSGVTTLHGAEAWAGALAYTFQIYFDFSGYTDMALGISRSFNIALPINFAAPYRSTSIVDFWRRWHISLSTFLRDYLYIPLGGNRHGPARRYLNLFATMLLGGLWHGAAWTFVVWGALHGLYLGINHFFSRWTTPTWPRGLNWLKLFLSGLVTFIAVVVAWVFFRANSFSGAWLLLQAMFGLNGAPLVWHDVLHGGLFSTTALSGKRFTQLLAWAIVFTWLIPYPERWLEKKWWPPLLLGGLIAYLLIQCFEKFGAYSPYLYFQF